MARCGASKIQISPSIPMTRLTCCQFEDRCSVCCFYYCLSTGEWVGVVCLINVLLSLGPRELATVLGSLRD